MENSFTSPSETKKLSKQLEELCVSNNFEYKLFGINSVNITSTEKTTQENAVSVVKDLIQLIAENKINDIGLMSKEGKIIIYFFLY